MTTAEAWERHAQQWLAWTDPAHADGFWDVTWPALLGLLPPPRGLVVDIGCGEGRGSRKLHEHGYNAVGIERSATLTAEARRQGGPVVQGDAQQLPLRDGCATVAFMCMSLLDIDNADAALAEARRVLTPDGTLVAAILHPFLSSLDLGELQAVGRLRLPTPYLEQRPYVDETSRDGHTMTFTSIHRPLQDYLRTLFALGFVLTDLREAGNGLIPWMLAFRADLTPTSV
jgi:SAM-dependent methyltransferase